jgi:CHRD domain-containing protein
MRWSNLIGTILAAAVVAVSGSYAHAEEFAARLSGFNEIGPLGAGETGAILSDGTGTLRLHLDKGAGTIAYTLTYSGLVSVTQAHIHFGKVHVAGGIIAFLCTNLGNGPAGTPTCPASDGTVTGTITGADIVGPVAQNVSPGDFDALVDALTSNTAYGNVHTTKFPAGEIRGQLRGGHHED